jgi:predicted kinase
MEEGVPPQDATAATAEPASVAPRLEALFAKTLEEGWLKQKQCDGMMRGMVESVRSGKKTEDEALAEATTKLEGMRKGSEAKKKKQQKGRQSQEQEDDSPLALTLSPAVGASSPAGVPADGDREDSPAPRLEALFAKTLEEGWLKQKQCDGMMRGMVESVRSGKKTEDEALAEATTKLEGMRKGSEAKKKKQQKGRHDGDKKQQQQKQQQQKQQKKQKVKRRAPQQILQQLGPESKAEIQLDAAKHIVAMCFQLRGQDKREFQDALTPALQLLTAMAVSDIEERISCALHALYVLCAHHKAHVVMLAATDIVATIAKVLQSPEKSLGAKTNACLVLNALATNCFETHSQIVTSGALPCLIDSLVVPKPPAPDSEVLTAAVARLTESLSAEVKEALAGVEETEKILLLVRGPPGSGKTHLARGVAAYLKTGLICSADSYFMQDDQNGQPVYKFEQNKMKDAHAHCQMQFTEALTLGTRVIIVDNTNLKLKEYADYSASAKAAGYRTLIFEVQCRDEKDAEVFFSRCVHRVPLEQIKTMARNCQSDPSSIKVDPWVDGGDVSELDATAEAGATSPITLALDGPSPRLVSADPSPSPRVDGDAGVPQTPRRGQAVKPLRFSTIKILNSLTYNPAMRDTLIAAGVVDALNARLLELTGQDQRIAEADDWGRMAMTCSDEYLWTLRASIKLVGQQEVSLISEELQTRGIRWMLAALSASLDGKGFPFANSTPATPAKYAQDIHCLAISDANAKLLIELNAFELMRRTLLAEWSEDTAINMNSDPLLHAHALNHATATLSMLSFTGLDRDGEGTRQQIQESEELMKVVRQLAEDHSTGVITPRVGDTASALDEETKGSAAFVESMRDARKQAKVLLLNLKRHGEQLEPLSEAEESDDEDGTAPERHIMLSYCWGQADANGKFPNQQLVLRLRESLQRRGYNVWMDVDDLSGSTLNAMADAVEKADVVIVVMTRGYKESAACRMEADYAYELNGRHGLPKIVPLKAEQFRPDGWLGMLLGSKLYFNFYDPSKYESELEHMVRKNLGECANSMIGGRRRSASDDLPRSSSQTAAAMFSHQSSQSTRSPSPSSVQCPQAVSALTATAPAPERAGKPPPMQFTKAQRTQSTDSVGSPPGEVSPSFNGFPTMSPLPGHPAHTSTALAPPSEQLLSTVSASIDSAERGRAAAERALIASEERVKLLEKRLADEQDSRLALLAEQMDALRLQNAALEAANFLQRRDPDLSAKEGGAEAVELDQWLSGINLARYTPALIKEGFDALEFVLAASEDEIISLSTAAGMKAPHAQKFRRKVASLKDGTAAAGAGAGPDATGSK